MTLVMLVMGSQIVKRISHTTWLQQSYTVHPQAVRSKFHMYRKEKKGERASWYITFLWYKNVRWRIWEMHLLYSNVQPRHSACRVCSIIEVASVLYPDGRLFTSSGRNIQNRSKSQVFCAGISDCANLSVVADFIASVKTYFFSKYKHTDYAFHAVTALHQVITSPFTESVLIAVYPLFSGGWG